MMEEIDCPQNGAHPVGPDERPSSKPLFEREVWAQGSPEKKDWYLPRVEPLLFSLDINDIPALMKDPEVDMSNMLNTCIGTTWFNW